ncbi:MAG: LacI family DNA-binding transcriptional regulator [Fibrella sp.]|nr:LacI family DNA-binding transcriptional regulator [Armatimonadota bacterium]
MATRAYRKSSIKDVARLAGVSTTTVSYLMNGREDVCAAETAKRIRMAIAELQYTPNSLTRGLRQGETRTIGVCLYSPLDPELRFGNLFFEQLWRGIVRETDAVDYSLLHYPLSVRGGTNSDAFLDGRVDGLLFHGLDDARAQKVLRAGLPAVVLTRSRDLPDGCGTAFADEEQTVRLALDHLFGFGHRRIAHLAGPVIPNPDADTIRKKADDIALLRLSAYTSQMQAAGYYDPALIGYADSWRDAAHKAVSIVMAWQALPDPPTAVLCANDVLAAAVVGAAIAIGLSVPENLSVVGIDDSVEARDAIVPLTSVAVPVHKIGQEAVRSLLRLMAGEPAEACRVAVPVTDIVVRGSTARCSRKET